LPIIREKKSRKTNFPKFGPFSTLSVKNPPKFGHHFFRPLYFVFSPFWIMWQNIRQLATVEFCLFMYLSVQKWPKIYHRFVRLLQFYSASFELCGWTISYSWQHCTDCLFICRAIPPTIYSYPHGQCRSVAVGGFLLGGGVNWMGTYNK